MTESSGTTSRQRGRGDARRSGFNIGSVLGFPLRLSASWIFLAIVIVLSYRGTGTGGLSDFALGFGFVASLLISVLLHELGHALTARRFGIGVKNITLDLFGGYTEFESDSPRPGVELATAMAGPAVSVLLGVAASAATAALPQQSILRQIALQLAVSNLIIAAYNSLPGWPLDGGRALRAAVWAIRGDRDAGLLVAGWSGRVVALLTAAAAAWLYAAGLFELFGLLVGLFIGFTIWQGASAAVVTARVRSRYPLIDPVRLARPVFAVPSGTSLAEADRRAQLAGHSSAVVGVCDADGRLTSLVIPAAAQAVPDQRRPWVTVETVSRGIDSVGSIPATARGADVIKLLRGDPATPYLVTAGEDGPDRHVIGVLTVMDVVAVLDPSTRR